MNTALAGLNSNESEDPAYVAVLILLSLPPTEHIRAVQELNASSFVSLALTKWSRRQTRAQCSESFHFLRSVIDAQPARSYSASTSYIAASCNRFSRVADCAVGSSLVAFGSSKFIALWDTADVDDRGIFLTLPGHGGSVTCVKFACGGRFLFSADDKGVLKCWNRQALQKWSCTVTIPAHNGPISALEVFDDLVVTGSSDAHIAVFRSGFDSEGSPVLQELQRLDLCGRYPLDLRLARFPNSKAILLAVGSTDRNITLWTKSEEKFVKATTLQGHEDWVITLDFRFDVVKTNVLTLASGSQDGTIRLWNIELYSREKPDASASTSDTLSDALLDSFEASLGDIAEGEEGGRQISMKQHILTIKNSDQSSSQFSVTFDALLIGHEAGINSVTWQPSLGKEESTPVLLSTSTDSSVILWSPSPMTASSNGETASIWINHQRFGDVGGQRLGGFVGGLWAGSGNDALAWGWAGGWRKWRAAGDSTSTIVDGSWVELGAISGHRGPVLGASWSPNGEFLISTGPDQTTRIHGNCSQSVASRKESWHEICRPQVHGYDLIDAAFVNSTKFISIADEKVARVFDSPRAFIGLCEELDLLHDVDDKADRPIAAAVPPLGLSNKATAAAEVPDFYASSVQGSRRRPFEGELALSTLWPESEKLFGHGYELHALSVSHSGRYVATACKATSPEHAGVIIYDTKAWQQFGDTLLGHSLTITRISFSPDDKYILSVSRDRSWVLHQISDNGYIPLTQSRSHARIIWDCCWSPDGDFFATASRDKTVKLWKMDGITESRTPLLTMKTKEAATAISISSKGPERRQLLAVGLENGEICIYVNEDGIERSWKEKCLLDGSIAHTDQIHRLSWRPCLPEAPDTQLASCSEDGTLRVMTIQTSL